MFIRDERPINDRDVLVTERLGRTQYLTPDGYLYVEGVRMASTQPLLYLASEVSELEAQDGMVLMLREPDVLFSQETLSSFEGKCVTIQHPDQLVDPRSYRRESVGVILHPRQGAGEDAGFLIADLMIKDATAIHTVQTRQLREVSCGYDSDREQIKPGVGRFTRIIGNHVALVDRGRCGPDCAIGDELKMAKKSSLLDLLRKAFAANDRKAFDEALQEMGGDESEGERHVVVNVHAPKNESGEGEDSDIEELKKSVDALVKRFDAMDAKRAADEEAEAKAKKEAEDKRARDEAAEAEAKKKEEDEEKEKAAAEEKAVGDRYRPLTDAAFATHFRKVLSDAEILAPGIRLPAFDAKATRKASHDAMCDLRRAAVTKALDGKHKQVIGDMLAGRDFSKMACSDVESFFAGAVNVARVANNAEQNKISMDALINKDGGPMTPAKMQAMNEAARKGK